MGNKFLIGLVAALLLNTGLFAQQKEKLKPRLGLSVQPGGMVIQQVKLGEIYDLHQKSGVALLIENRDNQPHSYVLSTAKPSQVGNQKWLTGYLEIPDPRWFWFETNEVTVAPQSKGQVKMFLKIPDHEKYYNQHWTVSIMVSGKAEKGGMLALAVYPRYQIETESKADLTNNPDGLTGVAPAILTFKDVALGKKVNGKVRIYNNDKKMRTYKITPRIIKVDATREQIIPSPGYSWVPDIKWVMPDKQELRIKPGESAELMVTVYIPREDKYYRKKWVGLMFVQPDIGPARFVRVQIDTKSKK